MPVFSYNQGMGNWGSLELGDPQLSNKVQIWKV